MKGSLLLTFVLTLSSGISYGQSSKCVVGNTTFSCPSDHFVEIRLNDTDVRAFKYKSEGSSMVFYIAAPNGEFDQAKVGKSIAQAISSKNDKFSWKRLSDVFEMDTKTKYKYHLVSFLGLSDEMLVEIKAFIFNIRGKKLVLGYLYDWSDSKRENIRTFEKGNSLGGSGPGCNAVVTALNSVTKEFKEKEQYCTLQTFTTN